MGSCLSFEVILWVYVADVALGLGQTLGRVRCEWLPNGGVFLALVQSLGSRSWGSFFGGTWLRFRQEEVVFYKGDVENTPNQSCRGSRRIGECLRNMSTPGLTCLEALRRLYFTFLLLHRYHYIIHILDIMNMIDIINTTNAMNMKVIHINNKIFW